MEPRFLRALDKVSATIDRNEVSQPPQRSENRFFVRHFPLVNCFAETGSDMEGGGGVGSVARSLEKETNQIKKFLDKTFFLFSTKGRYTIN
jgi:hypothetical protein